MWGLWPPVPLAGQVHDVVHLDGIHLHRQAVVLIAIAGGHVIGWYVARRETGAAWSCLMSRIAPPLAVVCDGVAACSRHCATGGRTPRCSGACSTCA